MRTSGQSWWVIGLTALSIACGADPDEDREAARAERPAAGAEGMDSMPGMAGMAAMQMGGEMTAHMERMKAMRGDSLMQMVPKHRQMLGNTMGQMNREMQGMNMTADPRWTALADSLRSDLVRMPEMSAAGMEAFMLEHHGRVERFMERHRSMMGGR